MRRVAAILNRHAGGVTPAHVAAVRDAIGAAHVWATGSLDEARAAAAAVAGYDVVCTGGGDGTFVQAVTDLVALGARPIVFGLRLGTGNAIADVCGAGPATPAGLRADLARARGDEAPGVLRLLAHGTRRAHSAGIGLDAEFNLDLDRVAKAGRKRAMLRPFVAGARGVAATAVVRTLPRLARGLARPVRITTRAPALRLGADGAPVAEIAAGTVVWDGPLTIAAASTVRTYGRGVVFFPHAFADPDRFQLRIAHVGAIEAVRDLVRVLRGDHAALTGVTDLLVSAIELEPLARAPAHVGGEVFWPDGAFTIALAPERLPILLARQGASGVPGHRRRVVDG